MSDNKLKIMETSALDVQTRAEIDITISTAKSYPRDEKEAIKEIERMATRDQATAASCFYALPKGNKIITGESVRLAEIIAYSWGNLNAGSRIVSNDGKVVTAQAVCHDLQRNVRLSVEIARKITDKDGRTYSEEMQIVTANAAASMAYRNAVFKVVPKSILSEIIEKIKAVAIGNVPENGAKVKSFLERAKASIAKFAELGVTEEEILDTLKIFGVDEIDNDKLICLAGFYTSIKDGIMSADEIFRKKKEPISSQQKVEDIFGTDTTSDNESDFLDNMESDYEDNSND